MLSVYVMTTPVADDCRPVGARAADRRGRVRRKPRAEEVRRDAGGGRGAAAVPRAPRQHARRVSRRWALRLGFMDRTARAGGRERKTQRCALYRRRLALVVAAVADAPARLMRLEQQNAREYIGVVDNRMDCGVDVNPCGYYSFSLVLLVLVACQAGGLKGRRAG